MDISLEYLSAGCNHVAGAVDWTVEGTGERLVAYASHRLVIIFESKALRTRASLLGHKARVTFVHWLPALSGQDRRVLVSGAADGSIALWAVDDGGGEQLHMVAPGSGHSSTISSIASTYSQHSQCVHFVSVAGDSTCCCWHVDASGALELQQTLNTAVMHKSAAMCPIPGLASWRLLFLGGVDAAVRVFCRPPDGAFEPRCTLRGHDNWVTGLAATAATAPSGAQHVYVASASQDRTARLWRLTCTDTTAQHAAAPTSAEEASAAFLTSFAQKHTFQAGSLRLQASIHGVLVGHEDWVHSVCWVRRSTQHGNAAAETPAIANADVGASAAQDAVAVGDLTLVTASMDRTVMLWAADRGSGLWMCEESIGDAGADSLGYYTACACADAAWIITNSYTGAIHAWERQPVGDAQPETRPPLLPQPCVTGHWRGVVSHAWAIDGQCLLTASADQTLRLHAREPAKGRWFEFARPQVHGHDFHSVAEVPQPRSAAGAAWRYVFASASEEKVVRVFAAPRVFVQSLAALRQVSWEDVAPAVEGGLWDAGVSAAAPALGLSNKAVREGEEEAAAEPSGAAGLYTEGPDMAPAAKARVVEGQPLEEDLCAGTLWPEVQKLYGHGNDVFSLAACPHGSCLVSACKAQSAAAANIRVWDVHAAEPCLQQLPGHSLTITQLRFSADGRFLLSVSRDRSFCLFARPAAVQPAHPDAARDAQNPAGAAPPPFEHVGCKSKAHDRIIWAATWAPHGRAFATGSRDKVLKVWQFDPAAPQVPTAAAATASGLQAAVTAAAYAPVPSAQGLDVLAVGFESGDLELFTAGATSGGAVALDRVWQAGPEQRHAAAVKCLEFQCMPDGTVKLASSGADHSLRVLHVPL
eukprot:jgi/Ulvmu1/11102/UM070_0018.1